IDDHAPTGLWWWYYDESLPQVPFCGFDMRLPCAGGESPSGRRHLVDGVPRHCRQQYRQRGAVIHRGEYSLRNKALRRVANAPIALRRARCADDPLPFSRIYPAAARSLQDIARRVVRSLAQARFAFTMFDLRLWE